MLDRMPESQRIVIFKKDKQFYRDKVRQIESSISSALEMPLVTPLPSISRETDTLSITNINDSSIGLICRKRLMPEDHSGEW